MSALATAQAKLKAVQDKLAELQANYDEAVARKNQLEDDVEVNCNVNRVHMEKVVLQALPPLGGHRAHG